MRGLVPLDRAGVGAERKQGVSRGWCACQTHLTFSISNQNTHTHTHLPQARFGRNRVARVALWAHSGFFYRRAVGRGRRDCDHHGRGQRTRRVSRGMVEKEPKKKNQSIHHISQTNS
jgi:hypothetical protein